MLAGVCRPREPEPKRRGAQETRGERHMVYHVPLRQMLPR